MSISLATIVWPEVAKGAGALFRLFEACMDETVRYFARRATIKSLREFDDRALRDIGLLRCQIEPAVKGFMTAPEWRRVR